MVEKISKWIASNEVITIHSWLSSREVATISKKHRIDLQKFSKNYTYDRKEQASFFTASSEMIIAVLQQFMLKFSFVPRIFQLSNDAILITDEKKRIIAANPAFEELTGFRSDEILGKKPENVLKSGLMDETYYKNMWQEIKQNGFFEGQITDRKKDGTSYTVWQKICLLKDPKTKKIAYYIAVNQDISDILQKQKQIENLAYYDGLTGLANRNYFVHILDEMISKRAQEHCALLSIDLDNFNEINDTIGHKEGDILLIQFATFLQEVLPGEDIIARTGGDEFAIMATGIQEPEDALELADKIAEFSKKNLSISNVVIKIGVSIGIVLFPNDAKDSKTLLAAADIALKRSKKEGKGKCTLFKRKMQEEAMKKINLRREFKSAITDNALTLYYQPKFTLDGKSIVGFEALIRWIHPEKGLIPPDQFIPVAEESGLIIEMTDWIFQEVDRMCKKLQKITQKHFVIAVNISALHFKKECLIDSIKKYVDTALVSNGWIELEVTESIVMDDIELALKQLKKLNTMGINISLDDYGTGHSSLSYLKHLPVSTLKVDKSFVDGLCVYEKDYAIVRSTIELARSLKMKTVIEGVEDDQQLKKLADMNADYIQGYVYSRPLNQENLIKLLKEFGGAL